MKYQTLPQQSDKLYLYDRLGPNKLLESNISNTNSGSSFCTLLRTPNILSRVSIETPDPGGVPKETQGVH